MGVGGKGRERKGKEGGRSGRGSFGGWEWDGRKRGVLVGFMESGLRLELRGVII